MIKKIKKLNNKLKLDKKAKNRVSLISIAIAITMFIFFMIKETHAFYNYEMAPVPIFTGKVGNFAKQDVEEYLRENDQNKTLQDNAAFGLYRYVGTFDKVTNNYICFGTSDKDECTKTSPDTYMYRIIGITDNSTINSDLGIQEKQLKIIKASKYGTNTVWHSANNVTWDNASVNLNTLNNTYLNSLSSVFQNLITNHYWYIGDTTSGAVTSEVTTKSATNNKVGLMYVSDFFNAGGKDITNWLFIQNGLQGNVAEGEWTMSRRDATVPWLLKNNGNIGGASDMTVKKAIRPTFYISSDIKISGSGTIEDPFILVRIKPIINSLNVTNDTGTSITVEVNAVDDKKVTEYCYKLNTESNYTCTSSSTHTFIVNKDVNYYSAEIYVKDDENNSSNVLKKGIRGIKKRTRTCLVCTWVESSYCGAGYMACPPYFTDMGDRCVGRVDITREWNCWDSDDGSASICEKRLVYPTCPICTLGCNSWSEWSDMEYVETCEAGTVTTEASSVEIECES